ncbi:MAG: cation:proton antiporter, partial [Gammaproteobacteria bacterium]|nr:cation:proton antiporter [Gammaproteobacteria bacterium]
GYTPAQETASMFATLLPFMMFGILLAAVLNRALARQAWLSLPVALVICGFISSEIWVGFGLDTGLRWQVLSDLVFYLLLPILVFESAINTDIRMLRREAILIGALAIPLLLAAVGIAAMLMMHLMGATLGYDWAIALLIASMICATDPAAIATVAGAEGPGGRTLNLLEGESLINDGTTIALFVLLSGLLSTGAMSEVGFVNIAGRFLVTLLGAAVIGALLGWLFDWVIAPANDKVVVTASTLVLAFTSFWVAEHLLGLSGVVATLGAGLTVAWRQRRERSDDDIAFAFDAWRLFGFCASAMLFFVVGMSITLRMFQDYWLAMLAGVVAAIVSRAIIVFLGAGPLSRLPGSQPLALPEQNLLWLGGIRGAVAIALALSLSVDIEGWYVVQSTVYGVALFSLVFQPPLVPRLLASVDVNHRDSDKYDR